MSSFEVIMPPRVKPNIKIDPATTLQLLSSVLEESQVILHCSYTGSVYDDYIRIWRSTFLCPKECDKRSQLITAYNISIYPQWTMVKDGQTIIFTLVFSALPKACKEFDMIEDIPELGGFMIRNIKRNKTDVYKVIVK